MGGAISIGQSDALGKPSAPQAPDYTGAAYAQAAGNRYNQVTPYGNLTWSQADPNKKDSPWTSTITLSPLGQQTLDQQQRISAGMGGLAQNWFNQNQGAFGQPMDLQSVQDVNDKAYGAMTARLDPQWNQRESALQTQLANQGIAQGSEAYTNAMRDFNSGRNDAYQQANLGAIATMPQTYQLASAQYNQPLNQLNALRTGAQVQNPQFQQPGGGANLLGAAQAGGAFNQNTYNQQMGSYNAMLQGLFGIGGAAAGAG